MAPQLTPPGELVTEPDPFPDFVTASENESFIKVAPTVLFPSINTEQVPVPVQAPVHPAKTEPAAGVGVSVIVLPPL